MHLKCANLHFRLLKEAWSAKAWTLPPTSLHKTMLGLSLKPFSSLSGHPWWTPKSDWQVKSLNINICDIFVDTTDQHNEVDHYTNHRRKNSVLPTSDALWLKLCTTVISRCAFFVSHELREWQFSLFFVILSDELANFWVMSHEIAEISENRC